MHRLTDLIYSPRTNNPGVATMQLPVVVSGVQPQIVHAQWQPDLNSIITFATQMMMMFFLVGMVRGITPKPSKK